MAQVKVWNDNDHDYSEMFKEKKIFIPAHGHIEMEYYDAHQFKGVFCGVKRDADNQPIPQSFKKIRVDEPVTPIDAKIEAHACPACKFRGVNAKALFDHALEVHSAQVLVDEEAEKEIKSKKKAG